MQKIKRFLPILLFIYTPVFADESVLCSSEIDELYALLIPKSVHCNTNSFLPANSLSCSECPAGCTCSGGTLTFHEAQSSGINYTKIYNNSDNVCATNFPSELHAIYTAKVSNCSRGYYMPANTDGCVVCPENNYCTGGAYTFNETIAQGILECPDGMFAPAGSWECYEHLLRVDDSIVYLKSHKVTEPSLHVKYEDRVYYANMTTIPTVMNRDSTHFLKIKYNSTEYYVCDDTTYKSDDAN